MKQFAALVTVLVVGAGTAQLVTACSVGEIPLNGGGGPDAMGSGSGSGSNMVAKCPPRAASVTAAHVHQAASLPANSPLTAVGMNCLDCHNGTTASKFFAGGTVYKPDKVTPQGGVTVRIIPGNGAAPVTAITDDAGNFKFETAIPIPSSTDACFDSGGTEKSAIMLQPINTAADANCSSQGCHKEPGGTYGAIKLAD